ncbi:hypothetical protein CCACVL1_29818 [Corchorus capsularis]|uniref:RNase H type-1 domain-containing protein n=1 Tax=Corchorus capsularis TaxID=210143 RepID=A0A1R3G006_COCAP|nr:hypothetical protein CCACVL1_29818 [Corchorus capsularis]
MGCGLDRGFYHDVPLYMYHEDEVAYHTMRDASSSSSHPPITCCSNQKEKESSLQLPGSFLQPIRRVRLPQQAILGVPRQLTSNSRDTPCWYLSQNGKFSLSSAYNLIRDLPREDQYPTDWRWVWKLNILPKLKFFIWECAHGILPTRELLAHRGLDDPSHCILCNNAQEYIHHLFKECPFAASIWNKIGVGLPDIAFDHLDKADGNTTFEVACFKAVEFFVVNGKTKILPIAPIIQVSWKPPDQGWLKLNTDGSSLGNLGLVGSGSVIRDNEGNWVRGSIRHLGFCTNFVAEFWALRDGLFLAVSLNIRKLVIELDSTTVIATLNSQCPDNLFIQPIVNDYRLLISKLEAVKIQHVFREGNGVADALAKLASFSSCYLLEDSYSVLFDPPFCIKDLLVLDAVGHMFCRTISI